MELTEAQVHIVKRALGQYVRDWPHDFEAKRFADTLGVGGTLNLDFIAHETIAPVPSGTEWPVLSSAQDA